MPTLKQIQFLPPPLIRRMRLFGCLPVVFLAHNWGEQLVKGRYAAARVRFENKSLRLYDKKIFVTTPQCPEYYYYLIMLCLGLTMLVDL